jgi:hypothetical protein
VHTRSLKMFQQRKPSVTKEWQQKLPDFVRRLEEALYRSAASKVRRRARASARRRRGASALRVRHALLHAAAASARRCVRCGQRALLLRSALKMVNLSLLRSRRRGAQEEYCNVDTLETRLQAVARRMVARPPAAAGDSAASGGGAHGLAPGVQGLPSMAPQPGAPAGAHGLPGVGGAAAGLYVTPENGGFLDAHGGGLGGAPGGLGFPGADAGQGLHGLHHLGGGGMQLGGLGSLGHGLKLDGDGLGSPTGGALGGAPGFGAGMGNVLPNGGVVLRGAPAGGYGGLVRALAHTPRDPRAAQPRRRRGAPSRRLSQAQAKALKRVLFALAASDRAARGARGA